MIVNVSCNECGKEFSLTERSYSQRKRSNLGNNLFCSRQCSGKGRKKSPVITTAQEDLDEWFKDNSSNDIIVGVGLSPTNNNNGGNVILNSEESNVMDEHLAWAAEMAKKNPEYLKMSLADIIKAEAQGEEVSNATPIAPAQPVVTPVQSNVVTPVQSNTVNPTQPMNQVPARWQDSLDDKDILNSVCDADYWDEAKTMKKCNPNPEANGQFRYSVVDPVNGLIFTQNGRICYRCQGKGHLSLRNLGYNWEADIKYNIIAKDTTFSQYVASKNVNGIAVQIPAGM